MIKTILAMGALRNLLHLLAISFTLLMPFADNPGYAGGWNLFFSGILPATAPIIVIVIGLDIMMSQVWKSEATEERIQALGNIITMHLIIGGILLASWLVVFLPVLT
jgi:hypothetical protein